MYNKVKTDKTLMGAGCFIMRGSEVLLIQRSDNKTWGTPGGTVELGEHVDTAIIREVKEEVGLDISDMLYVACVYTFNGKDIWDSHVYITRNFSGEIKIQEREVLDYAWVHIDNLRDYDLFSPTEMAIQHIEINVPFLFNELTLDLLADYAELFEVVSGNSDLLNYYRTDVKKLTAMEQLISIQNPGSNGGNGAVGTAGWRYKKPTKTTGVETIATHEGPGEYTTEVTAQQLRQDLLKWFKLHDVELMYTTGESNEFIFPEFETLKSSNVVKTEQEYENLFKSQHVLYQLMNNNIVEDEKSATLNNEEPEDDTEKQFVPITKIDKFQKLIYGKVLVPEKVDLQNDIISKEEIEKSAHNFLIDLQIAYNDLKSGKVLDKDVSEIGYMHSTFKGVGSFGFIAESFIDTDGAWVLVTKITDDNVWQQILDGKITGYSIGGKTIKLPEGVKFNGQQGK